MNSIRGEQITSTVVRSCREKNDSTGPMSSVEREKCESTIYAVRQRNKFVHGIRRRAYLHVYRARGDVTDEQVHEPFAPRAAAPEDGAEPEEEEAEAEDLGPPPPAPTAGAPGLERGLREVAPRVRVEVEAREREHDVEELVLHRDEEAAERVERHLALVVRGPERLQEDGRDREEGQVLDVRVAAA